MAAWASDFGAPPTVGGGHPLPFARPVEVAREPGTTLRTGVATLSAGALRLFVAFSAAAADVRAATVRAAGRL